MEDVMADKADEPAALDGEIITPGDAKRDDEIAALRREVAELKAAVTPPKSTFVPKTDAEWIDEMHQLREGRMRYATPPSVIRDFAVLDDRMVKEIALRDARAPTGRPGMIPQQQTSGGGGGGGKSSTPGWVDPRPLSNPPGTNWVDAIAIADDVRQRAELKRKLGG
jgi:hypothetical protein